MCEYDLNAGVDAYYDRQQCQQELKLSSNAVCVQSVASILDHESISEEIYRQDQMSWETLGVYSKRT